MARSRPPGAPDCCGPNAAGLPRALCRPPPGQASCRRPVCARRPEQWLSIAPGRDSNAVLGCFFQLLRACSTASLPPRGRLRPPQLNRVRHSHWPRPGSALPTRAAPESTTQRNVSFSFSRPFLTARGPGNAAPWRPCREDASIFDLRPPDVDPDSYDVLIFFNTRSPEVPTLSPGPVFRPEPFSDGPRAR